MNSPRTTLKLLPLATILTIASACVGSEPKGDSSKQANTPLSFNRDVRPILSDKCFFCHGPDENHRAADLRLDLRLDALDIAIVPGSTEESELIARLVSDDPDSKMPPEDSGKKISQSEIAILERWIQEGAPYEAYWAYVPPQPVESSEPAPHHQGIAQEAGLIDRLVRLQLAGNPLHNGHTKANSLKPAPRADRRSLLRRLHLDVTGLPPSFEQIQSFRDDPRIDAYERRVDLLLASPAFGERFAEYWLDLVRFADTVGYHGDQVHNIAPYRDYVINAMNDNLPLDQFSREQLAGDLLESPTTEQLVASGYNRLLQTTHEGGLQPKEYRAIYAADRVRNLSSVWMAATVGCAQCHDHKYDPYTAKDFYSLSAFFADVDDEKHFNSGTNALPTRREPEIEVLGRTDQLRLENIEAELREAESNPDRGRIEPLQQQRELIKKRAQRTMITKAITPRTVRFLPRGNWLDESGKTMQPAIPAFMGDIRAQGDMPAETRPTRLDLANWLFDVSNGVGGLTARVFANRLWYLYTGRGISPTLGDFGGQGRPPVNAKLLDHLALVLINSNWDLKITIRQILLSETYKQQVVIDDQRQSIDPYNDLSSSQSGHRLPAEAVRDSVLEIAGMLDHRVGGRSVRPYQPAGYYRHLNFPKRSYTPDNGVMLWRRGIYTHWQRQFLHPMLKALDAPSREECTAQRARSNTPLEALALLNDPTFVIASQSFAARILNSPANNSNDSTVDLINNAFRIALGRDADQLEQTALRKLLNSELSRFAEAPNSGAMFLAASKDVSIPWPPASSVPERAAWSSVARAILNLHETLYRP